MLYFLTKISTVASQLELHASWTNKISEIVTQWTLPLYIQIVILTQRDIFLLCTVASTSNAATSRSMSTQAGVSSSSACPHEHGSQPGGYSGYFGHKHDVLASLLGDKLDLDVTTEAVWRQAMFFFFFYIGVYSYHWVAFICDTPGWLHGFKKNVSLHSQSNA